MPKISVPSHNGPPSPDMDSCKVMLLFLFMSTTSPIRTHPSCHRSHFAAASARFLQQHQIDDNASSALRLLPPPLQRYVIEGGITRAQNPSAVLLSRMGRVDRLERHGRLSGVALGLSLYQPFTWRGFNKSKWRVIFIKTVYQHLTARSPIETC